MNKKLLAIAVAAAMAAPAAAMAEATVYGKVHVAIDYMGGDVLENFNKNTTNNDDADYSQFQVVSNSSRLGFKGSDDLGGGLTALWQYEVTVNVTEGSSTFGGGRNSYAGLKGGFGTVLVGRLDTPVKNVSRKYELFPEYVGDSRTILSGAGMGGATFDLRTPNTIAYVLPKMGALSGTIAYVTDHAVNDTDGDNADDGNFDAYSLAFGFDGGAFTVDVGYEVHNINQDVIATATTDSEAAYRIGAGFNAGAAKVVALYQMVTDEGFLDGNDRMAWGLGASYDMGGGNAIKAQYYMADASDNALTDDGASMYALGFDHKFSKATTAYVAYAATSNDDATTAKFDPWGKAGGRGNEVACEAGGDCNAFSVGVIHNF